MANSSNIGVRQIGKHSNGLSLEKIYHLIFYNFSNLDIEIEGQLLGKFKIPSGKEFELQGHPTALFDVDLSFTFEDAATSSDYLTIIYTQLNEQQ